MFDVPRRTRTVFPIDAGSGNRHDLSHALTPAPSRPKLLNSLGTRIVFFFVALLVGVQAGVLLLVNAANTRNAREESTADLTVGVRIVTDLLSRRHRELAQAAELLAGDFAFRQAVATHDLPTISSALMNHGSRINARVSQLVSTEGRLLADANDPARAGSAFPFRWLLEQAQRDGRASGMVVLKDHAYQLVLVPVLAPLPVAWAAFGIAIDDRMAHNLQQLSALDVSFLTHLPQSGWTVVGSTLPETARTALANSLPERVEPGSQTAPVSLGGEEYETLVDSLQHPGDEPVVVVLQRSLEQALAPFRPLHRTLLLLAAIGIGVSVLGSILIGRSITRPLLQLGYMTRRIEEGDYSRPVKVSGASEISELARRFDFMRTSIAARESEILRLAYSDTLTGLPNRVHFLNLVGRAIDGAAMRGGAVTVLTLNLDRFSYINETLGHVTGDEVLKQVAMRLGKLLGYEQHLARLGGDEFSIAIPGNADDGVALAGRIGEMLEQTLSVGTQALDVRASIGIASYPKDSSDADEVLRHADGAMSMAKQSKNGYMVYDSALRERREEKLSLLSELRHAIDSNELRLVYEPKVDISTGTVSAVEALVRWRHPVKGILSPGVFIPFAEQTGFIKTVTAWVIASAAAQCARWIQQGHQLQVSVNISAQDLLNPALPSIVSEALERHGLKPHHLCLEITEGSVMQDPARALEVLAALQATGMGLSIDDFGTGHSSLTYVKSLPVNELKIDRTFITHLAGDAKDRAIVLSTIALAHYLKLKVVAEGVEDARTLEVLRGLGCDIAQGFLFTRSLDPESVIGWIEAHAQEMRA